MPKPPKPQACSLEHSANQKPADAKVFYRVVVE
jgi:hypothetical protein